MSVKHAACAISCVLLSMEVCTTCATAQERDSVAFTVDAGQVTGQCDQALWGNIGYDPIYRNTVLPEFGPVWNLVAAAGGLRYVRCHNLLSDPQPGAPESEWYGCKVYTEDSLGNPVYDWTRVDAVLDTWLRAGCRPIIEADFMPDALAKGPIVRNYGGGAINPPKDLARWRDLVRETARHCITRYGIEEVRSWYWEVWNEPDLPFYFSGTADDLNAMYDHFVDGVTSADSLLRVGGPGIAGVESFFRSFLRHCVSGTNAITGKTGTRIDFISWHGYGSMAALAEKTRRMRAIVTSEFPALADRELQANEWGQELNPNPVSTLTSYEAVFLARFIDLVLHDGTLHIDKFLRWGAPAGIAQQGIAGDWRTLAAIAGGEAIPLAILNAYDLLSRIGPDLVTVTGPPLTDSIRAFATRRIGGLDRVHVVAYNFQELNPAGAGDSVRIVLTVRGLAGWAGARLYHRRIDFEHGDAFAAWVGLGMPQNPTPIQLQVLKYYASRLDLAETEILPVNNDETRLEFHLRPNALSVLEFVQSEAADAEALLPPADPQLGSVYPQPARVDAALPLTLTRRTSVTLSIHDALGRKVADVFTGELDPGHHTLRLPVATLPTGIYFCRLTKPAGIFATPFHVTR